MTEPNNAQTQQQAGDAPVQPTLKDLLAKAPQEEVMSALEGRTFKQRVKGEDREVTLKEMQDGYSRAAGADAKFREAAKGIKALELMDQVDAGDMGAAKELMALRGATPADIAEFENFIAKQEAAVTATQTPKAPAPQAQPPHALTLEELPENIQKLYYDDLARKNEAARLAAFKEIEETLDIDPKLGILKKKEGGAVELAALTDITQREVWRRVALGEPNSPELVADVLQSYTRPMAERLRLLESAPPDQDVYPSVGPAGEIAPTLQSHEPPKRVPVGHPKRAEYMKQRAAWLASHPEVAEE